MEPLGPLAHFAVLCVTSFFTLMNPLATAPVFSAATAALDKPERARVALKAVLVALAVLLVFALLGDLIFRFFGITVHGLRIAGGVLFFGMGLSMLQAKENRFKGEPGTGSADRRALVEEGHDFAITPLAIPMIAGPGAIANALILARDAPGLPGKAVLLGALLLVLVSVYLVLVGADRIIAFLGKNGLNVLKRIMGLIVMVIAVEFCVAGLRPIVVGMLREGLGG